MQVLVLMAFICAPFTATVASEKGYKFHNWFLGGLLFGPIALLAAVGLPDLKSQGQDKMILQMIEELQSFYQDTETLRSEEQLRVDRGRYLPE